MRRNLNDRIHAAVAAFALIGAAWMSPSARGQADPFGETDPVGETEPAIEAPATEAAVEGPDKPAGARPASKNAVPGTTGEAAAAADPTGLSAGGDSSAVGIRSPDRSENIAELLAAAMTRNPDIAVAEAKVRSAQVELDRTRLDVSRQIIEAVQAIRHQRRVVEVARMQLESSKERQAMMEKLYHQATIATTDVAAGQAGVGTAELALAEAEAKLEAAIASLDYLTGSVAASYGGSGIPGVPGMGMFPGGGSPGGASYPGTVAAETEGVATPKDNLEARSGPTRRFRVNALVNRSAFLDDLSGLVVTSTASGDSLHERLRRTLEQPTSIQFVETPLSEALAYLDDLHGISNVVIDRNSGEQAGRELDNEPITLKLENVPLHAALRAIEDVANVSFVVTSYGLVLTVEETRIKDYMPLKDFMAMPRRTKAELYFGGREGAGEYGTAANPLQRPAATATTTPPSSSTPSDKQPGADANPFGSGQVRENDKPSAAEPKTTERSPKK
ncbi:MAG: TolC family protein [Pirellulales bacterium]